MIPDFEYKVKNKLLEMKKNQSWLIEEVKKRYDGFLDSAYMSRIISGKRQAPEIQKVICSVLGIE